MAEGGGRHLKGEQCTCTQCFFFRMVGALKGKVVHSGLSNNWRGDIEKESILCTLYSTVQSFFVKHAVAGLVALKRRVVHKYFSGLRALKSSVPRRLFFTALQ